MKGTTLKSAYKTHNLPPEVEYDLFCQYKNDNNISAKTKIVEAYLKLVLSLVNKYSSSSIFDDLLQEGTVGLLKCIDSYDYTRDTCFGSYARIHIKSQILRYIQKQSHIVDHIKNRSQSKIFYQIRRYDRSVSFSHQQLKGISEDINVSVDSIKQMEQYMFYPCLDIDEVQTENILTSDILSTIIKDEDNFLISNSVVDKLDPRESEIIQRRFLSERKTPLRILAKNHSISIQRVSQLEKRALDKLRKYCESCN